MAKLRIHYHAGEDYEGGEIFLNRIGICGMAVQRTTKSREHVNCYWCLRILKKRDAGEDDRNVR